MKLETPDQIEINDGRCFEIKVATSAKLLAKTDNTITVAYYFVSDTLTIKHVLEPTDQLY